MHYVIQRSQRMQKHKFGVIYPGAPFVESILVPHEHTKLCLDVSCLGRTRMHYVTQRSYWMPKYKFSVTCPDALFMETTQGPPKHKK
jgi:hypothetical protein